MCQIHTQWSHFSRQLVTVVFDDVLIENYGNIIMYDDLAILLWWNTIKNNSNPSTPKSVTTAPRFGTWGPIADAITVTTHSPTIVTTYTSHKNTKSPSLASGTNKKHQVWDLISILWIVLTLLWERPALTYSKIFTFWFQINFNWTLTERYNLGCCTGTEERVPTKLKLER